MAGGLGHYTGIDPLIFRIVLVVLTVFGGSGALLYALGWLFIPEEGQGESEAQRFGRGHGTLAVIAAAALAFIGLIVFGHTFGTYPANTFGGFAVLAVVAVVAYLVLRSDDRPVHAAWQTATQPGSSTQPTGEEPVASGSFGQTPGTAYASSTWKTRTTSYAVPTPPPVPRERSLLGRLTFSAAALVAGVLLAVRAASPDAISFAVVPAAALLTVGVGLLVGAFYGRSRWLILLGVLLVLATALAAVAGSAASEGIGSREWTPGTASEVLPSYRLGMGEATLDLRGVSPAAGEDLVVDARVGIGDLIVLVPADAALDIDAEARAGAVWMPDETFYEGLGEGPYHYEEPGSASAGTIELDLRVGMGSVEVRRDAS